MAIYNEHDADQRLAQAGNLMRLAERLEAEVNSSSHRPYLQGDELSRASALRAEADKTMPTPVRCGVTNCAQLAVKRTGGMAYCARHFSADRHATQAMQSSLREASRERRLDRLAQEIGPPAILA